MDAHGFLKVAAAIPEVKVADCGFNTEKILGLLKQAEEKMVKIVCFPELCISGYTCGDLFLQDTLLLNCQSQITKLLNETKDLNICYILGAPVKVNAKLYNCAIVCQKGHIKGIVPKRHLPNYSEFYEKRWFADYNDDKVLDISYAGIDTIFGTNILFGEEDKSFAVEICEDIWSVIPPSSYHAQAGAKMIFNLSASDELTGKQRYVKDLLSQQSARCLSAYVYSSAGFGESTTDLVYAGNAYIYEKGRLLAEAERFQLQEQLVISEIDIDLINSERKRNTTFPQNPDSHNYRTQTIDLSFGNKQERLSRYVNPTPFIPSSTDCDISCEEIFSIQLLGLAKRLIHINAQSLIIGISGGLDSTLALLVCAKVVDKLGLPRKMICGVTMPGFGTTDRTYNNALGLMDSLGITVKEIDIKAASSLHFKDIGHDPSVHDVVYENTQARERTQILMDLANQMNGLVIGTGDMSELALGWATYNGDQMSMYGVNSGVPKTLVRYLVRWLAETQMDDNAKKILLDVVDTPVSPELLPTDNKGSMTQLTEDVVGPYELHDFFLYYTLRYGFTPSKIYFLALHAFENIYDKETILKWMGTFFRKFFNHQFKRSCMPDGPKIGSVNLSPRGDWRMPSDASSQIWINEIENLKKKD